MSLATLAGWRIPHGSGDPFWDDVVLLLGFDDQPDGSTTFIDESPIVHTVTGVNGALIDTDAPLVGSGSLLLDGAGARLNISNNAAFGFGTGPWTWEARGVIQSFSGSDGDNEPVYDFRTNQFEDGSMIFMGAAQTLAYWDGTTFSTGGAAISVGVPFDDAITYDGTTVRGYLSGVRQFEVVRAISLGASNLLRIGDNFFIVDGADRLHGSLDEMRATRRCRYTGANYTPVAGKFPRF